jgi:hypothetical protein
MPRVKNSNTPNAPNTPRASNAASKGKNTNKNTSGLEKFSRARDVVLARHGITDLTGEIRKVYEAAQLKGFDGWRNARDTALKNFRFPDGYASLMQEAKREFSKL